MYDGCFAGRCNLRFKTINEVVKVFRQQDPDTAFNRYFLLRLLNDGKIPFEKHGNRAVCDYDNLLMKLNNMLGLGPFARFLRLRSIEKAVLELKKQGSEIGIGEDRLRELISVGMVPTVQIGNRNYLAMEMFSPPFDRLFNSDAYVYKDRGPIQTRRKKYSEEQLSELFKRANKEAVMCRV